jgi:tripartite-type tricarboxylate transporter receptor subunit TctC
MPDAPTIAEAGVPGYEANLWYGLIAVAHTPDPLLEKLSAQVEKTLREPDIIEKLARQGVEPYYYGPRQFATRVRDEIPKWSKLIKDAGLRIE